MMLLALRFGPSIVSAALGAEVGHGSRQDCICRTSQGGTWYILAKRDLVPMPKRDLMPPAAQRTTRRMGCSSAATCGGTPPPPTPRWLPGSRRAPGLNLFCSCPGLRRIAFQALGALAAFVCSPAAPAGDNPSGAACVQLPGGGRHSVLPCLLALGPLCALLGCRRAPGAGSLDHHGPCLHSPEAGLFRPQHLWGRRSGGGATLLRNAILWPRCSAAEAGQCFYKRWTLLGEHATESAHSAALTLLRSHLVHAMLCRRSWAMPTNCTC